MDSTFEGKTLSGGHISGEIYGKLYPIRDSRKDRISMKQTHTPETVTITWLNYDGTMIDKTTVAYGTTPEHADPTIIPLKEGKTYTFNGWSPELTAATQDMTYVATFMESDESGESTPVPTPTPVVTPEDPDNNPTSHIEPPSITTISHTYEIYQIFTGDYYNDPEKGDILSNLVWGQNGAGTSTVTVDDEENETTVTTGMGDPVPQAVLDALNSVLNEELDRTKLDVIEQYVKIDGEPYRTITLNDGPSENSIQLPSGYYLIRDVETSQTGRPDAYTTYITVVIKEYTIQPKSVIPSVDKQVYDNNEGANGGNRDGWAESADHNINETFQFALIGTIPNNAHLKDYTEGYTVKFTDTMSAGVTFDSIASVTVNETPVAPTAYEVDGVASGESGKTWTLTMDVKTILGEAFGTDGINVIVTYNAHLNENAIVHTDSAMETETNRNTVYMEYSNNPNTGGKTDMGKTESDSVWVFTYSVQNKKVDGSDNPLAGAGFTLLKDDTPVKLIQCIIHQKRAVYL